MILVTRGIIVKDGKVLAAQRPPEMSLAFLWELPGGKVDGNESLEDCLHREIDEEFGITVNIIGPAGEPFERSHKDKEYRMIPMLCEHSGGELNITEHLQAVWQPIDQLHLLEWAPAERELIKNWATTLQEVQTLEKQSAV